MTKRLRDDLDTFAQEYRYICRSDISQVCQSLFDEYREPDDEDRRVMTTVTAAFV